MRCTQCSAIALVETTNFLSCNSISYLMKYIANNFVHQSQFELNDYPRSWIQFLLNRQANKASMAKHCKLLYAFPERKCFGVRLMVNIIKNRTKTWLERCNLCWNNGARVQFPTAYDNLKLINNNYDRPRSKRGGATHNSHRGEPIPYELHLKRSLACCELECIWRCYFDVSILNDCLEPN